MGKRHNERKEKILLIMALVNLVSAIISLARVITELLG
jgi:hypothetical protein